MIATLSRRFSTSDLDYGVSEITFPSFPSHTHASTLDHLIVIIPKAFLTLNSASESVSPIPTHLPAIGLLSRSILQELLNSLHSVLPILDILVYKLPRLIWMPESDEMRSRFLPAQRTIGDISPDQDLVKLCDESDEVFIMALEPRTSWLKLCGETIVREHLAELSRITASPRAPLSWKFLEYPTYTVQLSTKESLSSRLLQEMSLSSAPASNNNRSLLQSVYDVSADAHLHICNTFNALVAKMANAREDAWTWAKNRERMEQEAELALDYERMKNAKLVAERFHREMEYIKTFTRSQYQFNEDVGRWLPTELALLYWSVLIRPSIGQSLSVSPSSSSSPSYGTMAGESAMEKGASEGQLEFFKSEVSRLQLELEEKEKELEEKERELEEKEKELKTKEEELSLKEAQHVQLTDEVELLLTSSTRRRISPKNTAAGSVSPSEPATKKERSNNKSKDVSSSIPIVSSHESSSSSSATSSKDSAPRKRSSSTKSNQRVEMSPTSSSCRGSFSAVSAVVPHPNLESAPSSAIPISPWRTIKWTSTSSLVTTGAEAVRANHKSPSSSSSSSRDRSQVHHRREHTFSSSSSPSSKNRMVVSPSLM